MNKDSIYKIIGYRGEYSENVKKALKKILKANHPDHGGNIETFKLINEVKEELENQKVSYKFVDKKSIVDIKYEDIDFDYCEKMIKKLQKDQLIADEEIKTIDIEIKKSNELYKNIYKNSQDARKYLLNNNKYVKELSNIKRTSIIMLLLISLTFFFAIFFNNIIIFIIFGLLCFLLIAILSRYFIVIRNITKNNEKNLHRYIKITKRLSKIIDGRESLLNERWNQEQKKKKIENDLRFYNNLIK